MRNLPNPFKRWCGFRFPWFLFAILSNGLLPGLAFLLIVGNGCKSVSHYISPRIEGRVVDSASHQPIQAVEVRRVASGDKHRTSQQPKGGQLMMETPVVRTAQDGTFAVDSQSALGLFRKFGWYSVRLSFRHADYEDLTASWTVAEATNSPAGEPLVKAGDISLRPLPK